MFSWKWIDSVTSRYKYKYKIQIQLTVFVTNGKTKAFNQKLKSWKYCSCIDSQYLKFFLIRRFFWYHIMTCVIWKMFNSMNQHFQTTNVWYHKIKYQLKIYLKYKKDQWILIYNMTSDSTLQCNLWRNYWLSSFGVVSENMHSCLKTLLPFPTTSTLDIFSSYISIKTIYHIRLNTEADMIV